MKTIYTIVLVTLCQFGFSQTLNKSYNLNTRSNSKNTSISAGPNHLKISTKVLFNAVPDGYRITFTSSFIGKTVEEIETLSTHKIEKVSKEVKKFIDKKDIVSDVISIDPIFDYHNDDTPDHLPSAYKITLNISFSINSIIDVQPLSKACITNGIYDIIDVVPFLKNTQHITDSLAKKSIEVLNQKKQLAKDIGFSMSGGKPNFNKEIEVYYPNERYLKSYVRSSSMYRHHFSQNFTVNNSRKLDVDNYYNLNLKDADYIFNAETTEPVIQFMYRIKYNYNIPIEEEEKPEVQKQFYIIDKKGKMKQIDW